MNKKILIIVLIVLGLIASVYLVARVQEIRKGATFTGNTLYFLPETAITKNVGEDVLTNVYLAVGADGTKKVDAVSTKICYGSNLTLATTDVTATSPFVIQSSTIGNGCLNLVVTASVAGDQLPVGDAIPVATLKFKAVTNGTGSLTFDKTNSSASGLVNGTVQGINIDDVRSLSYTIGSATSGGKSLYFQEGTSLSQTVGLDFLTHVYVTVGTEKVDAVSTKICYGSNLTLATTNVTAVSPFVIQSSTISNGCLNLVVTASVSSDQLPTGSAIPLATLKFRAATVGTGSLTFDKANSSASGLVNGTVGVIAIDDVKNLNYTISSESMGPTSTPFPTGGISMKFSLAGLKPNAMCETDIIKKIRFLLTSRLSGVNEISTVAAAGINKVSGVTNANGDQVFLVNNVPFTQSRFTGSDNTIRVKGIMHAQMKYCRTGQTTRVSNDLPCDIKLGGPVYDFSGYPVLAGDVTGGPVAEYADLGNVDGVINVLDFSYIKTRLDPAATPTCAKEGDLNGDGVVNNIDIGLVKSALSYRDDE